MNVGVGVGVVAVPGATLRYETRGSGPVLLLVPGGAGDAGMYEGMADRLAAAGYTVVSYDQRGLSRSPLDGPLTDQSVAEWADDALAVLDAVSPDGDEPAYVFGGSSGGIVALALLARHPGRVRRVVAHEPPLVELLADPAPYRDHFAEVRELQRTQGLGAAMARFAETPDGRKPESDHPKSEGHPESEGHPKSEGHPDPDHPESERHPDLDHPEPERRQSGHPQSENPDPENQQTAELPPSIRQMADRMKANMPVFLEHVLCPFSSSAPDLDGLRAAAGKLVLGVGRETGDQEALVGPARRLAESTGAATVEFPGGHVGCVEHPEEFAELLLDVLAGTLTATRR
ncbi:alpha/beta fold hydrolase [Streptomyces sp. NPDC101115]|uniref:alpha/beta fold hydrolase n=1 Tax=Streptomyces sp. NPDC101115 TaxID=3366106 RepID=UPI003820082D